jgi:hypothetical protein
MPKPPETLSTTQFLFGNPLLYLGEGWLLAVGGNGSFTGGRKSAEERTYHAPRNVRQVANCGGVQAVFSRQANCVVHGRLLRVPGCTQVAPRFAVCDHEDFETGMFHDAVAAPGNRSGLAMASFRRCAPHQCWLRSVPRPYIFRFGYVRARQFTSSRMS